MITFIGSHRPGPGPGCPRPRRGAVQRALAFAALGLLLALTVGAGTARADTIFSDGFESGDFSAWSQVQVGGDGKAVVQSAIVHTGTLAAQLSETATAGSKAYVRRTFSSQQMDLTATGDFQVLHEGVSGGNVPFFRFFDPTSARLVSLYRQNGGAGKIYVGYGGANFATTGKLALSTWGTLSLHVIVNGTGSTVVVRLDGNLIYQSTDAGLGSAGISTVQIGNETAAQPFTLVVDTVSVDTVASAPSPPVNTAPPTISGAPQAGQTLSASTGTWTGAAPLTYTYQWQRCDANALNCVQISGATRTTYPTTSADKGMTLRVAVTASNSVGSATSTSSATTVVQGADAPPVNTTAPAITGTPQNGQGETADSGTWTGTQPMTFTDQWQRCNATGAACVSISGATDTTYVITDADVGSTLRVVVTATNGAGSSAATSAATTVVQPSASQAQVVALWHMDETSGTTMFDSIGGHNGTLVHVATGVPGFMNLGYGFNGTNSYVSVPSTDSLNPGSANVTVTIHLKTTGVAPAPPKDWDIIRKGDYVKGGTEFKMEFQQSGQASCGFEGSSGYSELVAGPKINDGQWHTVQCVKTATAIAVVVDGVTFSQKATLGAITNTSAMTLGAHPGADWYDGSLDEASLQIG
jgi:Concanavalin A-like lectin/glucanases superfamily